MKTGDKATILRDNPDGAPLYEGEVVTILRALDSGIYEVEPKNQVSWYVDPNDLEELIALPRGDQLSLSPISEDEIGCDCGEYAVYKSMSPQFHSYTLPCSSLKGNV